LSLLLGPTASVLISYVSAESKRFITAKATKDILELWGN